MSNLYPNVNNITHQQLSVFTITTAEYISWLKVHDLLNHPLNCPICYILESTDVWDWKLLMNMTLQRKPWRIGATFAVTYARNTYSEGEGANRIVEIDESVFVKREYHVGHVIKTQWVFGAIERDIRRCLLVAVADRTADTLLAVIQDHILPATTIISEL
uniref:ISXO2-like transposase domain-containing protein n=1 Tax=Octopus bimaculoides TaxID=37653 RepID=A0A0L8G6Y8_OCTBM